MERRVVRVLVTSGAELPWVVSRIRAGRSIEIQNAATISAAVQRIVASLADTGIQGVPVAGAQGFIGKAGTDDQHHIRVASHSFAMGLMAKGAGIATSAGPASAVGVMRSRRGVTALAEGITDRGPTSQHTIVGTVEVRRRGRVTSFTRGNGVSSIKGRHTSVTGGGEVGFGRGPAEIDPGQRTDMTNFTFNGRGVTPDRP